MPTWGLNTKCTWSQIHPFTYVAIVFPCWQARIYIMQHLTRLCVDQRWSVCQGLSLHNWKLHARNTLPEAIHQAPATKTLRVCKVHHAYFYNHWLFLLIKAGLSLQREPDCAAQTLSTRNCPAQKQKGEAEMCITKDKGLKGEQKNLIFGKQECASKQGITAMGMRTSFHGWGRTWPESSSQHEQRAVGKHLGWDRGGQSSSLQHPWYHPAACSAAPYNCSHVGPREQPGHSAAPEHAAECFHVSHGATSELSLMWESGRKFLPKGSWGWEQQELPRGVRS